MAAETVLVTIATSLASGLLKEVSKKAVDAVSESSTVAGLKSAIFGGLETDLHRLEKELCTLESVLGRAEGMDPMQFDNKDLVLTWLRDVKDAAFYADNLLDEIAYEKFRRKAQKETSPAAKLLSRSDTSFSFRLQIAGKIKKFVSRTAVIQKEAETKLNLAKLVGKASLASYQTPPTSISENLREIRENPDTSIVMGREADEELIVAKLCSPNQDQDLPVLVIVGRSGVGKTTLARMVYDNKTVGEHFGKRTWIFVSDHFKLERFLDEMLQSVTGQSHNLSNKVAMEDKLQESLKEEKKGYLLVLDDVWNTDDHLWNSVKSLLVRVTGSTGCRVLVTTQSFDVARIVSASPPHHLKDLGKADAWELFEKIAFANKTQEQRSGLEDVGRRILSKCKGLPLAIKTMGSLLGSMNDIRQWESVERSEIWGLSLDQSSVIKPWLLISFHHLPNAAIKQCFVHCAMIIEKGTFVSRSDLIHAWMAQGFIQSTGQCSKSMEDVGETYVETLVSNGLLHVYNRFDGRRLWIHDLVHGMACFISRDTSSIVREAYDLQSACEVEHLRICGENTLQFQYDLSKGIFVEDTLGFQYVLPKGIYGKDALEFQYNLPKYNLPKGKTLSKLRTLICTQASLSIDFVGQASFLRDLRLIHCGLERIPSSIGRLKHLRYLSLRKNSLKCLSESIGKLLNLQIIDLRECDELIGLPQEITMLVNLRHILTPVLYLNKMPKGMGKLTCLRTIPEINLKEKEGFEIKELGSLPLLNGHLRIGGLEYICCQEDVAEASLNTKEGIKSLTLWWNFFKQREAHTAIHDEEIMDGLHPHSNLESILVIGYGGKRISSWLPDMKNLREVGLHYCGQCEQLPTLGQLCFLERVDISGMRGLEVIGIEFYHKDDGREVASTSSSHLDTSRRRILFRQLKSLRLRNMEKLREWVQPSGSTYELFPCLEYLEISDCPLLVNLTCFDMSGVEQLTCLKTITISKCKELGELCHTPTLHCMGSLKRLQVEDCDSITSFPDIKGLSQLIFLSIKGCKNLSSLPGLERCVSIEVLILSKLELSELCPTPTMQCMGSLKKLKVEDCDSLTSFPDIEGFSQLSFLSIERCKNLSTLPGLERCVSIEVLILSENPKMEWIPDLTNLSRLTLVIITDFSRRMSIPPIVSEELKNG